MSKCEICGEAIIMDGICTDCSEEALYIGIGVLKKNRLKVLDSISTKNEMSNTIYKEETKVDNIVGTHSQNKELMDRDYALDKLNEIKENE